MNILPKVSVDYDLVVIGMSAYAHKLVSLAAQRRARVAWVWDQGNDTNDTYVNIAQIHHILQSLKNKIGDRPKPKILKLSAKHRLPKVSDFHHTSLL